MHTLNIVWAMIYNRSKLTTESRKRRERGGTCSSCTSNIVLGVPGDEDQPGFVITMSVIEVWERHIDATQPNLAIQVIVKVKNHTYIHWDYRCWVLGHSHFKEENLQKKKGKERESRLWRVLFPDHIVLYLWLSWFQFVGLSLKELSLIYIRLWPVGYFKHVDP